MRLTRLAPLFLFLSLAACSSPEAPQAPPGAVERLAAEIDQKEAAERLATIRRNELEEKKRREASAQRIAAIDRREGRP